MYRHSPLMRSLLSQSQTPTAPRRAVGFMRFVCFSKLPRQADRPVYFGPANFVRWTTRGAFHRQGPFIEFGAVSGPIPRLTMVSCDPIRAPLNGVLTPSWVSAGPSRPYFERESRPPFHRSLGPNHLRAPCSARPPFTRTATLFGALRASLFRTRRLPADFCNVTTTYGH